MQDENMFCRCLCNVLIVCIGVVVCGSVIVFVYLVQVGADVF